jgi:hypothetical protein
MTNGGTPLIAAIYFILNLSLLQPRDAQFGVYPDMPESIGAGAASASGMRLGRICICEQISTFSCVPGLA